MPSLFNENHVFKIINTWISKENIALNLDKSGFLFQCFLEKDLYLKQGAKYARGSQKKLKQGKFQLV